jgi:hypothetical protein
MRHPFDGLNLPEPLSAQPEASDLDRRSALEIMAFAAAGLVALPAIAAAQVTNAVGEAGAPPVTTFTTLALGEEGNPPVATAALNEAGGPAAGVTTEPFGEEAGRVTSRAAAGLEDGGGAATQAVRETGATTQALGEEGATTNALNEEGATTKAVGEEGGGPATTAKGEQGAAGPVVIVKPLAADLNEKQLEAAWKDLGVSDSAKAVQACAVLYGAKQAIAFLKDHLKVKFPPVEEQRIAQLVADLDADAFGTREKAEKELAQMGPPALPALKAALAKAKSAEVRMRLQRLIDGSKDLPELRQAERGLQVLVALRTPEAKQLIEQLAKGDEKEWLTQEAKKALARMPK